MIPRKTGSETSARLASLASQALRNPKSLTEAEIKELAGSVLGQREPPTIPIRPDRPAFPNLLAPNPFRRKS
jgi:hypothetical protein